jgi:hypothetical protein
MERRPIYMRCGSCSQQVLMILGGTLKKAQDGKIVLVCPFCGLNDGA